MGSRRRIEDLYFEFLCEQMTPPRKGPYKKLLRLMHNKAFRWSIARDENRAKDGMEYRDAYYELINQPTPGNSCSVLEMMAALSERCETDIMEDSDNGHNPSRWFYMMLENMGLDDQTDRNFDEVYCDEIIDDMLDRKIGYNGEGGLFSVTDPLYNMADAEIWMQLMWFLSEEE